MCKRVLMAFPNICTVYTTAKQNIVRQLAYLKNGNKFIKKCEVPQTTFGSRALTPSVIESFCPVVRNIETVTTNLLLLLFYIYT